MEVPVGLVNFRGSLPHSANNVLQPNLQPGNTSPLNSLPKRIDQERQGSDGNALHNREFLFIITTGMVLMNHLPKFEAFICPSVP